MKRRDKDEGKPLWIKKGRGKLYFNGQVIGPGEKFRANPEELPKFPANGFSPVDPDIVKDIQEPIQKQPTYALKAQGRGWYDVINTDTDKTMSEKKLRREDAEELIRKLSEG